MVPPERYVRNIFKSQLDPVLARPKDDGKMAISFIGSVPTLAMEVLELLH